MNERANKNLKKNKQTSGPVVQKIILPNKDVNDSKIPLKDFLKFNAEFSEIDANELIKVSKNENFQPHELVETEDFDLKLSDNLRVLKKYPEIDFYPGTKSRKKSRKKFKPRPVVDLEELTLRNLQERGFQGSTESLSNDCKQREEAAAQKNEEAKNILSMWYKDLKETKKRNLINEAEAKRKAQEILKEQENLSEVWYEVWKRRCKIKIEEKNDFISDTKLSSTEKRRTKYGLQQIKISMMPKEIWGDDEEKDEKEVKSTTKSDMNTKNMKYQGRQKLNLSTLLGNVEESLEKFVFVDDENSDEDSYNPRHHQQKLNKSRWWEKQK